MKNYSVAYLAALASMAVLDFIWLGFIAKPWYEQGIGHLMKDSPNLAAAGVFYLLYPVGVLVFALVLQPEASDLRRVALVGALFGFFAYATYDLTNLATLRQWPVSVTLIDIAWGTVISGLTAAAAKLAFDKVS